MGNLENCYYSTVAFFDLGLQSRKEFLHSSGLEERRAWRCGGRRANPADAETGRHRRDTLPVLPPVGGARDKVRHDGVPVDRRWQGARRDHGGGSFGAGARGRGRGGAGAKTGAVPRFGVSARRETGGSSTTACDTGKSLLPWRSPSRW